MMFVVLLIIPMIIATKAFEFQIVNSNTHRCTHLSLADCRKAAEEHGYTFGEEIVEPSDPPGCFVPPGSPNVVFNTAPNANGECNEMITCMCKPNQPTITDLKDLKLIYVGHTCNQSNVPICGDGTQWSREDSKCVVTTSICGTGTTWSSDLSTCVASGFGAEVCGLGTIMQSNACIGDGEWCTYLESHFSTTLQSNTCIGDREWCVYLQTQNQLIPYY